MRVALCIGSLDIGGAEKQLVGLASCLREEGVDVQILVMHADGPLGAVLRSAGIETVELMGGDDLTPWHRVNSAFRWIAYPVGAYRCLRRYRPDVVHAWLLQSYGVLLPVAWLARVPVRVCGRRGMRASQRGGRVARLAQSVANAAATWTTCNSQAIADEVVAFERVAPSRMTIVGNGVAIPHDEANPGVEPPIGVVVANFHDYKGHLDLIEALHLVGIPVRMIFVGEGGTRAIVQEAASHLPDTIELSFLGQILAPSEVQAQCQYAVLPSRTEGLPNAVLEAMAVGLPVVATSAGGTAEILEDGRGGYVVPPEDAAALADGIRRIATETDYRISAGAYNRAQAGMHSWNAVTMQYTTLYRHLCHEAGVSV